MFVFTDGKITSYSTISGYSAGSGISATVYGNYLTFAFKDNTGSNHLYVVGTADGTNYTGQLYNFSQDGNNEISLSVAVLNNNYHMVITGNSSIHRLWTACTTTACNP